MKNKKKAPGTKNKTPKTKAVDKNPYSKGNLYAEAVRRAGDIHIARQVAAYYNLEAMTRLIKRFTRDYEMGHANYEVLTVYLLIDDKKIEMENYDFAEPPPFLQILARFRFGDLFSMVSIYEEFAARNPSRTLSPDEDFRKEVIQLFRTHLMRLKYVSPEGIEKPLDNRGDTVVELVKYIQESVHRLIDTPINIVMDVMNDDSIFGDGDATFNAVKAESAYRRMIVRLEKVSRAVEDEARKRYAAV